jgi:hypothetical protein
VIFAIDIDGTISSANANEIYSFFVRELGLDIPASVLETLPTFGAFLSLPQVVQFRKASKANERLFLAARHNAIKTPSFLLDLVPMPHAADELHYLTSLGEVRYCTARVPEVQGVTQQWLERHGFPCCHQVECCSTIASKVQTLASYQPNQDLVLIDDRGHTDMLDALHTMPNLASRLSILAFGVENVPLSTTFYLRALPAWSHIREVVASLPH